MEKSEGKILVVEDEKGMREVLGILLGGEGYDVTLCDGGTSGINALKNDIYDLVISDLKMSKIGGLDILKTTKELSPETVVVIITAFGTTESAIEAMKLGAFDYIQKPFKMDEIRLIVRNALEKRKLKEEVSLLKEQLETYYSLDNIIGKSPQMQELFYLIKKIAPSDANVLIEGESGSGKELVAMAIHNLSTRKERTFVTINCAAIPEGLLESELFGYMKGAFTGAVSNKQGLFEFANMGTIFLDEIGEMPFSLQAKLLRVIEDKTFRRLGGTADIKVNVRIITATNKDLKETVGQGLFREDLYFRLNVLSIKIPPLRRRKEDIPLLIEHFLRKYSKGHKDISPDAMEVLINYPWRGNVRELENIIERSVLLSEGEVIGVEHLSEEIKSLKIEPVTSTVSMPAGIVNLERRIEDIEKEYLINALEQSKGVKTEAAKLLNLSFRSFRHKLKKYGIDRTKN
ncbi:MAG TPA: Fis family transcriptional regulator [Nitrospiraceae bacterium]|nr:Fis family transcriptional regulator [Nitrospiraceae bacterium]